MVSIRVRILRERKYAKESERDFVASVDVGGTVPREIASNASFRPGRLCGELFSTAFIHQAGVSLIFVQKEMWRK